MEGRKTYGYVTADRAHYRLLKEHADRMKKFPTEAEALLWEYVKGSQLGYRFRRQYIILDYIPDFVCLPLKLIIEIDGGYHMEGEQPQRDVERTKELNNLGYTVLRFTNEEVYNNISAVLQTIKSQMSKQESLSSLSSTSSLARSKSNFISSPLGRPGEVAHIGIYGGTFNPLHNGHVALARAFLAQAGLDEVWFVVSPQNPFKVNDNLLDDNLRLKMVEEALKGEPGLKVSDVEFHLPKPSYMYRTLRHLSEQYPQNTFTLLIGGDNWKAFDRWKNADEIKENYRIAVYPRRNDDIDESSLPQNVMLLNTPLIDISSTEIRQMVHGGQPIKDLVPSKIAEFIEKYNLYK